MKLCATERSGAKPAERKVSMDEEWSTEQLALRDSIIEFARAELNDNLLERDHQAIFSRENWRKCADFGIQGLAVAEQYCGTNQDIATATLAMEALGYGCKDAGLNLALNAQMWTVQHTIQTFGTEEQKQRFLPPLCRGDWVGAQAITEPEAGSDAMSLRTRATPVDGGYKLNGNKTMISMGPEADLVLVLATIDPEAGAWGVTAFLVESGSPGFSQSDAWPKMGLRTAPFGDLHFDHCFVPTDNRLGPDGGGSALFNSTLEWERSCMLASQLGAMQRQLEDSIAHARQRKQFGQAIGKFQSVSNRVAEMKVRLETARLLLYKVAHLKMAGKTATMEAAMAKYWITECYAASSMDAIRIHGGYGYMSEYGVERDLRDSIGATLYGGTSDIQRNIIAKLLGL